MKKHPRIMEAISTQPWLCTEEGLRNMEAIASYDGDIEALKTKLEKRHPDSYKMTIRDKVAIVPVTGPIFPHANLMTDHSGATALSQVAVDFQTAQADKKVETILLHVDSPGGVVTGINEMANLIAESDKKVIGYSGGQAASAGYWLLSACDEIVIDATTRLGSIGAVAGIRRKSECDPIEFVNTASPKKRLDPESEAASIEMIQQLDAIADVFIASIAEFRGVEDKAVRKDFGKGGMLVGQAAVDVGMADRLGSYESLIQELSGSQNEERGGIKMDLTALTQEELVTSRPDLVKIISDGAVVEANNAHTIVVTEKDGEIANLTEENKTLKEEKETLSTSNEENNDRIATLEKNDAIRAEQALEVKASSQVATALAASSIPERLHPKVSAGISKDKFVAEGVLDEKAFGEHIGAEIKDWTESLGDSSVGTVQGIGAVSTGEESDADEKADDEIVARLAGGKAAA